MITNEVRPDWPCQRACRRAFIATNARPLSTYEVLAYAFPRCFHGLISVSDPAGPPGGYPPQVPGASSQSAGDPVAYCMQRYRSCNPQTGTYLGTEGQRHPCP
jgi:hypothetical protein